MKNICAVIVSFNPSEKIKSNIDLLASQVDEILIVDNHSNSTSRSFLDNLEKRENISIFYNKENLGIAKALNIGICSGLERGYSWIATFDQDSSVTPEYMNTMLTAYQSCQYQEEVALVSPIYIDKEAEKKYSYTSDKLTQSKLFSDVKSTLTSGNLIKASIFPAVGMFDENLFIDYVDHEFCLRCRQHKFKIIQSNQSVLMHSLGDARVHTFLGRKFRSLNHNPLRRYYKYRNRIIVYKRYILFDLDWFLDDAKTFFIEPIKILMFETERLKKIFFIAKGICHGVAGIDGKAR
jgi:rhamnosyltransferase